MNEAKLEKEIQDKGLTAPRLTPAYIDDCISYAQSHVFTDSCLTVVCLTLKNGFTVTGESACASRENFNAEIGYDIAYANARDKIWMLEGYLLKQSLFTIDNHIRDTARVCHQINKAYCEGIGDNSQVDWNDAPLWQQDSAISGVKFCVYNPDALPSANHDSWLSEKIADGWVYGDVKDVEKKTHPCCVSYEELPREQQIKDMLFKSVVESLK